jgi:hypothetical protein
VDGPSISVEPWLVKGAAGILGGTVALTLDLPRSRMDLARRMFVSAVCGYVFPGPTLRYFGVAIIDPTSGAPDVELILAIGLLWGLIGWFVLGLVIRTFIGWRDRGATALDAAREIRDVAAGKDKS